jgi:hypothetical protein
MSVKPFIAGGISALVFHQGLLVVLYVAGLIPRAPFDTTPTSPLGVPALYSLAFWGGVWGVVLWPLILRADGAGRWILAALIGAAAPSATAWFVVMPLKGKAIAGGWDPSVLATSLALNASWGLGLALIVPWLGSSPTSRLPHAEPERSTTSRCGSGRV